MKKLHGFTLIELLIVVAIIAILAAIAVPNFLEAQTRSKVSRVRSDHRSLATAIETYYIDNNSYPAATHITAESMDGALVTATNIGSTFRARENNRQMLSITTPISYITSNFPDPFADTRGIGFKYWTDSRGWILGSFGPDVDQANGGQLYWNAADDRAIQAGALPKAGGPGVETVYDGRIAQPSQILLTGAATQGNYTYDPTNGTISPGDVWRVKQ